jgi:two-component system, sensor histidine kinase
LDEQRVKQVTLNLLQNALKFTFQGFIKVFISYDLHYQRMYVSVQDSGIGIKKEDQSKLFSMFGKLEDSSQMNTTGVGLGLSICKQIVEVLDG